MSFFLHQLAESINLSSEDVQRLAAAAQQISTNSQQVSHSAHSSSEQASKAQAACKESADRLQDSTQVLNQLNSGVVDAQDKICRLEQVANEIQSITDVINGISDQTNLLALNAAIEAARAGEHGRGFAVVADEVRALASKTADATNQIGDMLSQISADTQQTTGVMDQLVEQSNNVVNTMSELSLSFQTINELMLDSVDSGEKISLALHEQNASTKELSSAIDNLHEFLADKAQETQAVSEQANNLAVGTEAIFVLLSDFETGSTTEVMAKQAQLAAKAVGQQFEQAISQNHISSQDLFNFNYSEIPNTNPIKFSTSFDSYTDRVLPNIQEPLLMAFPAMIYAGAVDINGYFPTHNKQFSQPLTGNYETDIVHNRTKRMFDDATGIRCGGHQDKFLLQTYKRDTGEIMHDVSAPIYVNGRHWGGFRIGFKAK